MSRSPMVPYSLFQYLVPERQSTRTTLNRVWAVWHTFDLNYGRTKTVPKARTQKWHLTNAAWAPSKCTQKAK